MTIENTFYTVEAQNADETIQLIRGTTAYGAPFYRVRVAGICDKKHATLDSAIAHFGKATAASLRQK